MKMKSIFPVLLGLLAVLLAGCGEGCRAWRPTLENPAPRDFKVAASDRYVEDLSPEDVIVAVNGAALTKADFDLKLHRLRWTLCANQKLKVEDKNRIFQNFGRTLIDNYIGSQLAIQSARKDRLLTAETIVSNVEAKVKQSCRVYGRNPEQLDLEMPGGLYKLKETFEEMAWNEAFARGVPPKQIIDDACVSNVVADIDRQNAVIAASNATIRARLERLRADLAAGKLPFGEAVAKYDESDPKCEDTNGVWGVFQPSSFEDDSLRMAIKDLAKGGLSEVLSTDEGLMIVKKLDVRANGDPDKGEKASEPVFTLGRVLFATEDPIVLAYGKNMKEEMQLDSKREALSERLLELHATAKIVYPNGTNFWKRTQAPKRKRPAKRKAAAPKAAIDSEKGNGK